MLPIKSKDKKMIINFDYIFQVRAQDIQIHVQGKRFLAKKNSFFFKKSVRSLNIFIPLGTSLNNTFKKIVSNDQLFYYIFVHANDLINCLLLQTSCKILFRFFGCSSNTFQVHC